MLYAVVLIERICVLRILLHKKRKEHNIFVYLKLPMLCSCYSFFSMPSQHGSDASYGSLYFSGTICGLPNCGASLSLSASPKFRFSNIGTNLFPADQLVCSNDQTSSHKRTMLSKPICVPRLHSSMPSNSSDR